MEPRRMSAKEARASFSEMLGSVYYRNQPVIIEKNGKPVAAVISPEQFQLLQKSLADPRERAWQIIQDIWTRTPEMDEAEGLAVATDVVKEVRQEMHGQRAGRAD